jgi:hypothetical protein
MDWREVFEANKHVVGRAVHEAWAAEKIRQGFADHVFLPSSKGLVWSCRAVFEEHGGDRVCEQPKEQHHSDMLDYDDLAPHIQEYDIQTGIVGFRMGFEAAASEIRSRYE